MPQNKRKKTFHINELVDFVNDSLKENNLPPVITSGEWTGRVDSDGNPLQVTIEDAYRIALCNVVEKILHDTQRYRGFSYDTEKFSDPMQPPPLERHYQKYAD